MDWHLLRRLQCVLIAVAALAVTVGPPRHASAAPDDPADPATLSLRSLGFGDALAFYGLRGEIVLSIPVPPGEVPTELTGTVELPPNLLRGTLTVSQQDRRIVRIPLPANDNTPITIPLAGAEIVDNTVAVSVRADLVPPPDSCLYDPANPLRLVNAALRFTGVESPPSAVADFLPPILQRLTVYIPGAPSQVESDSALRLVAAIVAHYGSQNTAVTISPLPGESTQPPVPATPFERQIVVREGSDAAVTLQPGGPMPSLLITGTGGDIVNQVRLLTADLSRLAVSTRAVAGPLHPTPQITTDLMLIRDLGQPGVNATDLTNPRVTIPLDQARLGRSVKAVRVHLIGSYTPLPANLGGQVVVGIGGQTISRWSTDTSGTIDRWIDVPERLLTRYTQLDVEVQAAGNTGRCGEFAPIHLDIDGATAIQSALANPPTLLGFQSLPQALMPQLQIGIDDGDQAFTDTVRAATIVAGLQRLSVRPLATAVGSLAQAVGSSNPAILIAADGWDQAGITLPVSGGGTGPIKLDHGDGRDGPTTLTLDPTQPFGSLQTVADRDRTLLVATSNNGPEHLDALLSWLNQDSRRWAQLDGNAVLQMPNRDPIVVKAQAPQEQSPAKKNTVPAAVWWVAGALLALLLAGAWVMLRRRRDRETGG